jgi:hypothetical protein
MSELLILKRWVLDITLGRFISTDLSQPLAEAGTVGSLCKTSGFHGGDYEERRRLLVTASIIPSSPILVTLMKEALSSSETSVLT